MSSRDPDTIKPNKRNQLVNIVIVLASIVSLVYLFGDSLNQHVRAAGDPSIVNDDVRQQIWPFMRYHDPQLFRDDYIADYVLACMPIGYKLLYITAAKLWTPMAMSKLLPYLLLVVTLVAIVLASARLGGKAAAWCAVAFALSGYILLGRMTGGLPRSFAFPLFACAAAALIYGRAYLLAIVVCLGAAFYPMVSVVTGLCLAGWLLVLGRQERGAANDWSFRKRGIVVFVTAALAGLIVLPNALATSRYGPMISSFDTQNYPEVGPGGRYDPEDRAPFKDVLGGFKDVSPYIFFSFGRPISPEMARWINVKNAKGHRPRRTTLEVIVLFITFVGMAVLAGRRSAARRLLLMLLAVVIAYTVARQVSPYLWAPQRYLVYTVPILAWIMFPAAVTAVAALLLGKRAKGWAVAVITLAVCGLCLLFVGGRGSVPRAGYTVQLHPDDPTYRFISKLPPDVLIAGWPVGFMDNVPYVCHRRALVTYENHQIFHQDYAEEMRRRVDALIDAYYAIDPQPLVRLRDEFGVTDLLIDQRVYRKQASYMLPFHQLLARKHAAVHLNQLETRRQLSAIGVYQNGPMFILDLRRLPPTAIDH